MTFEQQLIEVLQQIVDKLELIEGDLALITEDVRWEREQNEPTKRPGR